MPLCITAVLLLCPHNQIVRAQQSFFGLPIDLSLAASSASALSPFRFCLLARAVALQLERRHVLFSGIHPRKQPMLGLGLLLLLLLLLLRLPSAVG